MSIHNTCAAARGYLFFDICLGNASALACYITYHASANQLLCRAVGIIDKRYACNRVIVIEWP